jgi:myo-inositol-1(or 4)-monophosphatase
MQRGDSSLSELGVVALSGAWAGVAAIMDVIAQGELGTRAKGVAHDLVTAADKASEAAVINAIRSTRPDDLIIGEETGVHAGEPGTRWLVDPLDGTLNFVRGRVDWAVSVGVEREGRPAGGAIVCPATGLWGAADGERMESGLRDATDLVSDVSASVDVTRLGDAVVSVGQPYALLARQEVLRELLNLVPRVRALRLVGGAASELLGLARGTCDVFLGFDLAAWDTAAGEAIVLSCGGAVRRTETMGGLPVVVVARDHDLADRLADGLIRHGH